MRNHRFGRSRTLHCPLQIHRPGEFHERRELEDRVQGDPHTKGVVGASDDPHFVPPVGQTMLTLDLPVKQPDVVVPVVELMLKD